MRTKKQNENKMMCAIGEATVNNNGKYGKKVTRMKSFPDTCVCVSCMAFDFVPAIVVVAFLALQKYEKWKKRVFFSFSLATCVRVVHVTTPSVYSPCVVCGVLLLFFPFSISVDSLFVTHLDDFLHAKVAADSFFLSSLFHIHSVAFCTLFCHCVAIVSLSFRLFSYCLFFSFLVASAACCCCCRCCFFFIIFSISYCMELLLLSHRRRLYAKEAPFAYRRRR